MKEIKYRAKRKDTGEWIYGGYHKHIKRQVSPIGDNLTDEDFVHLIIRSGFADWNMPKPLEAIEIEIDTLSQYTGLKDKEGVEIYAGDIIKDCEGSTRTIIWERNGFKALYEFIKTYEGERFKQSSVGELRETSDRRWGDKVIGNIYENPELLELEI